MILEVLVLEFELFVSNKDIFGYIFLLINIISTYFTTCNQVKIVTNKVSLYSIYFTISNWVKRIASKKDLLYL